MSFTFSKPSSSTSDNDTAQQPRNTGPVQSTPGRNGRSARPGSTRPVTPQSATGSTDEGDDNGNGPDSDIGPLTDREAFFTPTTLAELWVLARAARAYWKANQVFPIGLDKYALDIFMVASSPRPACVADIDEHNPTDHAALLGTLRGWEDELQDYIEEEQSEQEEGEELLPRTQEHRHLARPMEEQGVRGPTQGRPTSTTTLDSMPTEDLLMAQGLDEEQVMKDLGWTPYTPGTNPAMPKVLFINEGEDKSTQTCRWVRYSLTGQNPHIEGTMGYDKPLYRRDLHADPKPSPAFNDSRAFRDDHLQIFDPTHKSCGVVD
jgi:hypothetical protein